jgi:hypothetical protein
MRFPVYASCASLGTPDFSIHQARSWHTQHSVRVDRYSLPDKDFHLVRCIKLHSALTPCSPAGTAYGKADKTKDLFITSKSAQRGRLFQSGAARCWAPAPDTRQRQSSPRDGLIFSLRYNYFLTIQPIIIIKINGFCSKRKSLNDLWCVPSLRSFFSSF